MSRRRDLEDSRLHTLFAIPTTLFAYLYWELGRRQKITEAHEDVERKEVRGELAALRSETSEAKAKAAGAAEAEKTRRERSEQGWRPREHLVLLIGSAVGVLSLVVLIITYHPFS